ECVAFGHAAEPMGRLFHKYEVASLRTVAKNDRRAAVERPKEKSRNYFSAVAFVVTARTKIVEWANDDRGQPASFMVCAGISFACQLSAAVDSFRKRGMILVHRSNPSGAIYLGRRYMHKPLDPGLPGLFQKIQSSLGVYLMALNRVANGMTN